VSFDSYNAALTPAQQSALNQAASLTRWARIAPADRRAETQSWRDGFLIKLADQADPHHLMSDDDRMAAAKQLRRAHMKRVTAKSLESRKAKKDAREAAGGE
jgi:hypothetical protein